MISIQNLSFGYRKAQLYRDFSLNLSEPGVYGLFGRNGSGKSTLLMLLAGLLFPKGGKIAVQGRSPAKRHPDFLASVYIVPEEFHLPDLRPARLAETQSDFYPNFSRPAFDEYLRIFEIPAEQSVGQMSLGQKKKVAIAFALATFTPVLLLDEPTNGLDIISRDQFKAIMAREEQRQRIVLISTHQAHDLERIMSHILFIDGASLALSAPMTELARYLRMGVARDARELTDVDGLIHSEAMGEQIAYVAANRSGQPGAVHLELLYKTLSLAKSDVIAALDARRREASHV